MHLAEAEASGVHVQRPLLKLLWDQGLLPGLSVMEDHFRVESI